MQRVLVRITGATNQWSEPKLIGSLALRYEGDDTEILLGLLRLSPEAREVHPQSGYVNAEWYSVEDIGPVPTITFDEAEVVKS
jgi:hypothetical protein